jgi:RNase P/RNase MRP subunit POP5
VFLKIALIADAMRPIPPTLKDTPRYAYVPGADRALYRRIEKRYGELFGMVGIAQARLVLVEARDGLIIRVENTELANLRVTIASIDAAIGIAHVSGTLEKLRTNYLKRPSSRDATREKNGDETL